MDVLSAFFVLLLSFCATFICIRRRKFLKPFNGIPGHKAWPLLGNAPLFWAEEGSFCEGAHKALCKLTTRHGKDGVVVFHLGMEPKVILTKAATVARVTNSRVLIDKAFEYDLIKPWLGEGLLTSSGQKWRDARKKLTPAFHSKLAERFEPIINEQARIFVQILDSQPDDLMKVALNCTFDVILETMVGVNQNIQTRGHSDYVSALIEYTKLYMERCFNPLLHNDLVFSLTSDGRQAKKLITVMHDFTNSIIRKRKAELMKNTPNDAVRDNSQPLIDILVNGNLDGEFTEEEIRQQVETFIFAGFDTTALALTYSIYLLGHNPDKQEKLFREIEETIGTDLDREITSDDISRLPYLTMVIKEALRIYPPVPIVVRLLNEDVEIAGHLIPKGTSAWIFLFNLHRDEAVFPEPEKFEPERFTEEEVGKRDPNAFIPFSAGPRNCIGQKFAMTEMAIILAHVVMAFSFTSKVKREDIRLAFEVMLKTKVPLKVEFTRRVIN